MKTHLQNLAICLILFCGFHVALAQEQYMFKHLATKDGLSHNQINYIYKDSRGFMWFATAGGLNRYDGYNFKVFRYSKKDTLSLPDSYIETIQEDAEGNLWVETPSGYAIYNATKETFDRHPELFLKKWGINGIPHTVYIDSDKNFWFYITGTGVYQCQPATGKQVAYPSPKNAETITAIKAGKDKGIFLYSNGLIECVDKNSPKIVSRDNHICLNQPLLSEKYSLFLDKKENYWVYSKNATGLWIYEQQTRQWSLLDNSEQSTPYRLSSNVIQGIAEDRHGNIWLATDHGGLDIINPDTRTLINLQNDISNERSLSNNSINSIYCDDMNILWVGTYKKGLSYFSESIFKFGIEHLPQFKRLKNFDCDITVLEEDDSNRLWVGTNGNGLICMDRTTGKHTLYEHLPGDPASLSGNVIVSLCASKDHKLWIGTYLGGMDCFDGQRFIHYRHLPDHPNSLTNNNVWSIIEDKEGIIWIGTLGGGLQSFDPKTGQFTTYRSQLASDYISSLCLGKDNLIYIGTAVGITIYNKKTGIFTNLKGNQSGTIDLSNLNVHQLFEDSRGLLWIGTRDGLNVLDRKNDQLTIIRKTDGLVDDIICAIIEDNNKNMWITTCNGVSNIVVNTDPKNGQYHFAYYNYDEMDGLQNREFNMRSITKTSQNEILMGGVSGFNIFQPGAIQYNEALPHVVFTSLKLFNKEIEVDSIYDGNKILTKALNQTEKIELEYQQNVFSISFSGMNYILPEKNRYAYILEGFNQDWMQVDGKTHQVTYTSLPPGTYTFKVKAANSDGYWSKDSTQLTIVIRPPFWRSGWAYLIYAILLSGALLFARYLVLRNEREKFKLRQVELEAERKHELDDMKLRFFTNISHEFRTPLTLIISPLENLIKHAEEGEQKQKLVLIRRNAVRLLNLVNQLLDFRKNDVSGHQLNATRQDLIPFLKNICQSFMELTEKKNINLELTTEVSSLSMCFDEDKMEKIMMNLLSNAFKFTDEGGKVHIQVKQLPATENEAPTLEIRVTDTGKGVADEDKEHIFERFYQVQDHERPDLSGSGIGLHMVKEFVTLHQGTIRVEDNIGKGSIFVLTIPVVKEEEPFLKEDEKPVPQATETSTPSPRENDLAEPVSFHSEDSNRSKEDERKTASGTPLILLVDDNDDFRSFMKDSLKGHYNLCEARDGKEAWEMIPEVQPDMIISDVMMPRLDGCELCRLVKNDLRTSHIPLILLTARTAEEQKVEGLETGADDYITKPFNLEILSLRIRKLLEIRNMKQERFHQQIELNPSEITITSLDEKLIARAIDYVEKNMDRSELSVEELSHELGMSRVHLYKKLTSITGKSPVEFIRVIRLKRAAQLLRESQLNVSEIAYEVGFNNPKYFSKYFKEEFGMLPSEYKAKKGI